MTTTTPPTPPTVPTLPTEHQLREALASAYQRLARLGLNNGSAGNISCRFGEDVLISPTGADGDSISPEAFVHIAMGGEARGPGVPSSEWSMHTAIYRAYPQAQAVVHTHADACVALSCQRKPIPAFHYMLAGFGGDDVRCAEYATFGTDALAQSAVDALEGRNACLLANHGMICHAPALDKAVANAAKLETLARQYWMSAQLGAPVILSTEEMAVVRERYRGYGKSRLSTGR
ncbi:class II aldolase/adducin family protein [Variovorax sp. J22G73]|jgi:L-fuculose-phosphate aldolase|uniref:class II aldolase/adducin family protein n=1 Tax=unclassified Variovorax TaxID=663243 RepID=UPI000D5CD1DA|nr:MULTISPECIES: class II aldolase/adducin family protein [unclassified Variovorax]MDM0009713.1 class II aldolase/adducin family protein [Variovorax sp. J22R203]MDM0102221.1 class II aldolase/adducin family protein [Variovorax sp. J22G73]